MSILYWRQSYFEASADLAEAIRAEPKLAHLREFLLLTNKGLRKQSHIALSAFLDETETWPTDERRGLANWLLTLRHHNDALDALSVHPLHARLIEPTLDQWAKDDPTSPIPPRWSHDLSEIRHALDLDPADIIALTRYLTRVFYHEGMSTHELTSNLPQCYLGDPNEDLALLNDADNLVARLPAATDLPAVRRWRVESPELRADVMMHLTWRDEKNNCARQEQP